MRYGWLLALLIVLPALAGQAQERFVCPSTDAAPPRMKIQRLPGISSGASSAGYAPANYTVAGHALSRRYPISSILGAQRLGSIREQPALSPQASTISSPGSYDFYLLDDPNDIDDGEFSGFAALGRSPTYEPTFYNPTSGGCGAACNDCGICESCRASCWTVAFSGLVMTRDVGNRLWTTFETGNNPNQLAYFPLVDWQGGAEVRIGREFCGCGGPYRIEAVYWSLDAFSEFSSTTHANGVSSPLIFNDIEFGIGDAVPNYFDGAAEHRLWRTNEIHNFELNVVRGSLLDGRGGGVSLDIWAGLRYFRFDERVRFGSVDAGSSFGAAGGTTEAYLDDRIVDNLFGTQIGFQLDWQTASGMRFYLAPQTGLYVNYIENRLRLYRGDGFIASPTAGSGVPGGFPISSDTTAFSVLAQLDMGLEWQISRRWTAGIGYRVVAVSGIGLADMQIPTYVVDLPEIAEIDHNGDLLLHGALASLEWRF